MGDRHHQPAQAAPRGRAPLKPRGPAVQQRLESLIRLGQTLTATRSLEEILDRAVHAAVGLFDSSVSRFWLLEEDGQHLTLRAAAGARTSAPGLSRLAVGEGLVGAIAAGRAPLVVNDVLADPRTRNRERIRAEGSISFAGVPVAVGDRLLGVLTIATRHRHHHDAGDLAMLQSLANLAAIALDNARLLAAETSRRQELTALLEINKKIGSAEPTDALLEAIAEEAARLLAVDNAGFRLLAGDELVLAGLAGTAREAMVRERIRVGESLSGQVVAQGRSLVADITTAGNIVPEHREANLRLGYSSFLGVPLRVGDRIIGVLSFRARREFTARDRELAEAFAGQAAIVLEHARLYREASRQAQRMAALADVQRLLSETLDHDVVAQRIADSVRRLLEAHSSVVYRLHPECDDLVVVAVAGQSDPAFGPGLLWPGGIGAAGLALRERRVVATPDVLEDPRIAWTPRARAWVEQALHRAVLAVPLTLHDRIIGALGVGDRPGRLFTDDDIRLAQAFADQAALALDNARLFALESARRAQIETLAAIERELAAELDLERLVRLVNQRACDLFGAHGVSYLVEGQELVPLAWSKGATFDARVPFGLGVTGTCAAERRTLVVNDYSGSPHALPAYAALGLRRALAAPLLLHDRLLGVISLARTGDDARPFSADDAAVLESFATQAAIAIENARLHDEAERRRREAEVVADLARTINASLDLGTVLRRVVEGARELCGSDLARVALREPEGEHLVFRYSQGARYEGYAAMRVAPGRGASGRVLATGRPLRIEDRRQDVRFAGDYAEVVEAEGLVSELLVPIRLGDRVEGLLAVANRSRRPFTDRDEAVLVRLADHAAIAIQNAGLYARAREVGERLRVLDEVNRLISSSLDMEEVLSNLTAAVARVFDAPYASVWVVDPAGGRLRRSLGTGLAEMREALPRELEPGRGAVGWAIAHREPVLWTDVAQDLRVEARELALGLGLRYLLVYPIALGDQVLGAFAVNRPAPTPVTTESTTILASLAAQAAVAIDHARLYAETSRRLEQTRSLLEVAEILGSSLDSRPLLKQVTIKIAQVCRVDRCTLELWDGDRVIPVMSQFADGHAEPEQWKAFTGLEPYPPRSVPAQARALDTRRPVVVDDVSRGEEIPREWVEVYGIKSYLVVPLVRQDRVRGVMTLDYCHQVTPFQPWQVELATAIAGQLTLSLENTRLYAETQERLRETTTLLAVSRVLSEPASRQEMIRRISRETARAFGADTVGAYALDGPGRQLVPLAGYRVPPPLLQLFQTHSMPLDRVPAVAASLATGRAVWSADSRQEPGLDPALSAQLPPHAVLLAPLRVRGESMGVLVLFWWRPGRTFSATEVRLVEAVAAQVGLALENAELARQREVKLRETETLLAVSRALSSTLEVDTLLREFLRLIARSIGADSVGIWMLSADGEWLEPTAGYHVPRHLLARLRELRISVRQAPFFAGAVEARRPAFAAAGTGDPRLPRDLGAAAPHASHLFVPVFAKERLIGAFIAVWWDRTVQLGDSDLALMEAIASQAGVVVDSARLFAQNRRQVQELSVLHEVARAVTGQLDREALLATLRQHVPRVLDARKMVVLLLDDRTGELEVALRVQDGGEDPGPPRRYPASVGLAGVVLETLRPLRTDDYQAECRRRGRPRPEVAEMRHWLGAPMAAGSSVLGVLTLSREERPFGPDDERMLAGIADLAALALGSARLFEERTRAYSELAATQDQLVRTEKLRALGEMASGVAHDFNNLLAAILGRTQLLLQRVADPLQRQWLQVVERAALDGAQTVRRLQEFARVRHDQPRVPVDLNDVVRDALAITQSRWREEALRLGVTIEVRTVLGPVPPVAGDPAELREVMTNLILNAVDAMPRGGILTITTAAADGVELSVADTGVGMPESVRQRIFDPFFTTKGPQGTGLGLSITYGILSRHGASVAVESTEGRGSTFRLRFPPAPGPPPDRAEEPGSAASAAPLRCLVVDDEEIVGQVIGDVLESLGHRAVVINDGAAAIERFRDEPFDAVFTDLAMPGLSGWQVAQAVKATAPQVPVFVVTGFGAELSAEERRSHGVEAVFAKPLKIEDMVEAMALAARRRGRAATREEP